MAGNSAALKVAKTVRSLVGSMAVLWAEGMAALMAGHSAALKVAQSAQLTVA
jgi:hypothetical protein